MRKNKIGFGILFLMGGIIITQLKTLQDEIEHFEEKKRIYPKRKLEDEKRRERIRKRREKRFA